MWIFFKARPILIVRKLTSDNRFFGPKENTRQSSLNFLMILRFYDQCRDLTRDQLNLREFNEFNLRHGSQNDGASVRLAAASLFSCVPRAGANALLRRDGGAARGGLDPSVGSAVFASVVIDGRTPPSPP